MRKNVGGADRTFRFVVGMAALVAGAIAPTTLAWKVVLFALAAVALLTGLSGYCPLNSLLGINTSKRIGDL